MKKGRASPSERSDRLERLFDAGDHRAARALAGELLADAQATEAEHAAARALRARVAPDPGVAAAGATAVALALAVAGWLLTR
jgi:hypothetical protein